jgi:hypothetical protein
MSQHSPSSIVIAVSGHRELHADDAARLRAQVSAALEEIARAAPQASLHGLSALAAGADQLFAEQVLALQEQLGVERVQLDVPLPMAEEDYIASQEAPGSHAFQTSCLALRARAQRVFEVPAGGGALDGAAPYVRLADYIAGHADLLVALWDGDTNAARQQGGTFDVVMRYLATPGRAVLHLPARRANGASAAPPAPPALLMSDADGHLQRTDVGTLARHVRGSGPSPDGV